MDLAIAGKVAVVAASSRGLGRAAAESLAREGAKVVLSGRDPLSLEASVTAMGSEGAEVSSLCCDVTDPSTPRALVEHAVERFGGLHIVVSNAGGPPQSSALEVDDAGVIDAVNANFLSTVRLVREAMPLMRSQGWGRICCISSAAVVQAIPSLPLSVSARIALWGWIKVAASELTGSGITLNMICPGSHSTERMKQLGDLSSGRGVPMGDPADFGEAVAFLCSQAAGYINGAQLVVDGGLSLAL